MPSQRGFAPVLSIPIILLALVVAASGVYYGKGFLSEPDTKSEVQPSMISSPYNLVEPSHSPVTLETFEDRNCKVIDEQSAIDIVKNLPEVKEKYSDVLNSSIGFIYAVKPTNPSDSVFLRVKLGERDEDWVSTKAIVSLDKCGA